MILNRKRQAKKYIKAAIKNDDAEIKFDGKDIVIYNTDGSTFKMSDIMLRYHLFISNYSRFTVDLKKPSFKWFLVILAIIVLSFAMNGFVMLNYILKWL